MEFIQFTDVNRQIFQYLGVDLYSLYATSRYYLAAITEYVYSMEMPHKLALSFPHLDRAKYYSLLFEIGVPDCNEARYLTRELTNHILSNNRVIIRCMNIQAQFNVCSKIIIVNNPIIRQMLMNSNWAPFINQYSEPVLQVKLLSDELLENNHLIHNNNCNSGIFDLIASDIALLKMLDPKYVTVHTMNMLFNSRYSVDNEFNRDMIKQIGFAPLMYLVSACLSYLHYGIEFDELCGDIMEYDMVNSNADSMIEHMYDNNDIASAFTVLLRILSYCPGNMDLHTMPDLMMVLNMIKNELNMSDPLQISLCELAERALNINLNDKQKATVIRLLPRALKNI